MPKTHVYTDLSVKDALYLEIQGDRYEVSQFNASFACNEIPTAQCLLAVGRDATSQDAATPAKVHTKSFYKTMVEAKVWFSPKKEYDLDSQWPEDPQVIFEGYFMGFAYRKMNGKIQVVAQLQHWLIDLACSSCLTKNGHVSNPTQLNVAAVLESPDGAGTGEGNYISTYAMAQVVADEVAGDVWKAIKTLFCKLANISTNPVGPAQNCEGTGDWQKNDRALEALKYIEGDADDCPFEDADDADNGETYAVPLALENPPDIVIQSIAEGIGQETIDSYANTSFWDKLVGRFCPMLGLAVVPMCRRALVIADTPAYRGGTWKTIKQHEYDSFDMSSMLEYPLRGVGVVAMYDSETQAGQNERGQGLPIFGGCYVEESVEQGDGILQVVAGPPWLRISHFTPPYVGDVTQVTNDGPSRAAGADTPGQAHPDTPETFGEDLNEFYTRYAHLHYVTNMLRGRSGSLSGKLRFDIAPGSIIRIEQTAEKFLGGEDDLAMTVVAAVARTTITINAEAPSAATTFQLAALRRENPENQENRTSVEKHPLMGTSIHGGGKHGAPLLPRYDI